MMVFKVCEGTALERDAPMVASFNSRRGKTKKWWERGSNQSKSELTLKALSEGHHRQLCRAMA